MDHDGKKMRARNTQADSSARNGEAGKTAPGTRALKDLWNIPAKKKIEAAPTGVTTDIYATRTHSSAIPPRSRTRHKS